MQRYCVKSTYTILETIEKIDETHERAVLVINDDSHVMGVISQGDIIRALSSGKSLYARINGLVRPGFFYLKEKNMKTAYEIFKKRKITLMPIVDDNYALRDIITLEDIYNYLEDRT